MKNTKKGWKYGAVSDLLKGGGRGKGPLFLFNFL